MASVTEVSEAEELVTRMNSIRNVSEAHVAELHQQVQRLGDWREYVRAQPLVSLAAGAAIGYMVTSKFSGGGKKERRQASRPASRSSQEAQEQTATTAATAGITSGIMAFVGSLASAAVRQYALQKLRGLSEYDRP